MTVSAEHATTVLDVDGTSVPVLLYAGGTTGLVLLGGDEERRAFAAELGELAEYGGLSALALAGDVAGDVTLAAERSAKLLAQLGVEHAVVVAVGTDAPAALRATGRGDFDAVVLIEPAVPESELEPLLAAVPVPKLVIVRGIDRDAQTAAGAVQRHAVGPLVIRSIPGEKLLSDEAALMVAEATIAFAVGTCGDGSGA